MERFDTLDDTLHRCWHLLIQATLKRNDPMKYFILGSIKGDAPQLRTMVLRKVDRNQRKVYFFTDGRSPKVEQWRRNPKASALAYHTSKKVQIRASGTVRLYNKDETARVFWEQLPAHNRKDYAAILPPGTQKGAAAEVYDPVWNGSPSKEETAPYFSNFLVVCLTVSYLDCLHLHREGHQRAAFSWENGNWQGEWLVP